MFDRDHSHISVSDCFSDKLTRCLIFGVHSNLAKSFCSPAHVQALLKDYILFAEKDEELQKFILRQHQTRAVEKVVERCLTAPGKSEARRGLVWHTQGSGKTFTMIKAAELLFKAASADKPTVLVLIDRNELEDQMLRNCRCWASETSSTRTASRN